MSDEEMDDESTSADNDTPEAPASGGDGGGAPAWIVTFADLMSLLMCFFVMLLSMAQTDIEKFKAFAEGLSVGEGTHPALAKKDASVGEMQSDEFIALARSGKKTKESAERMRLLLRTLIRAGHAELVLDGDIITIRISQGGTFQPGGATLTKDFKPVARRLRQTLKHLKGVVQVTGHTDDQVVSSRRFRSNTQLSGARAYSVLHELLRGDILDEHRFIVAGMGGDEPLLPNDSQENRELNRRVEIVIDQNKLAYMQQSTESKSSKGRKKRRGKKNRRRQTKTN